MWRPSFARLPSTPPGMQHPIMPHALVCNQWGRWESPSYKVICVSHKCLLLKVWVKMVLYFSDHAKKAANVNRQHQFEGGGALLRASCSRRSSLFHPSISPPFSWFFLAVVLVIKGESLGAVWILKHKIIEFSYKILQACKILQENSSYKLTFFLVHKKKKVHSQTKMNYCTQFTDVL